jgi:glycosyltransferase involved in cell wall biosynthesis
MRIVIDMQGGQADNRFRGIGRYSLNFIKEFVTQRRKHEIIIALNTAFPDSIDAIRNEFVGVLPAASIRAWSTPRPVCALEPDNDSRRQSSEAIREAFLASLEPDWVIVTSLFEGLVDDAVTSVGRLVNLRTAVLLYDLIPWIYPDVYLTNHILQNWYIEKLDHLRRADLLLSISASSAREAKKYLDCPSDSAIDISTAADVFFHPLSITPAKRIILADRYKLEKSFVMYTGGIDHRKNIEGLIKAWSELPMQLRRTHQLAVVCHANENDKLRLYDLAASFGLKDCDLVLTGFVPDEDLLLLYNACELFVFPSWHEGFGLPALEAMQCGKPVLAANRASLPEVIGRDDALFDPFDTKSIVAKIERALTDSEWSAGLAKHCLNYSRNFSWDKTAKKAWNTIEEHPLQTAQVVSSVLKRRPRLAFVSPLPPERSGIADYSAELLRDLTRWYEIDVIVRAPADMNDAYIRATCGLRSVEYFSSHYRQYERVLYHFGNSEFHEHMFGLLEQIPGVVVLHDFFLSGIQAWSEIHKWRPLAWVHALYHSHGYNAILSRYQTEDTKDVVFDYPANLPVLQRALGVIVHSKFSCSLATQWYGQDASINWSVIPLLRIPIASNKTKARQRLSLPHDAFIIASFGILGELKKNHRLLGAFLESKLANRKDIKLVFVGMASGDYGDKIQRAIDAAKIRAQIRITGWVDTEAYQDWLQASDIAVQLRTYSRGETSAAVLDCLNHGLAAVVNAHGSAAELPRDVVWMLPDKFTDEQLLEALEVLSADSNRRQLLADAGRQYVSSVHNPRKCAEQYAEAIEIFYHKYNSTLGGLKNWLTSLNPLPGEHELLSLAVCVARNHPPHPRNARLFVDISELVLRDVRSGIQRVVRSILKEWLANPPDGFRIEPVYASVENEYRYARHFTTQFLGIPDAKLSDEPIDYASGDLFFALDLQPQVQVAQRTFYQSLRMQGVRVVFCVYDLLCIQLPQFFPDGAAGGFAQWLSVVAEGDGAICISRSVAEELHDWINSRQHKLGHPFKIGWFHLGADVGNSEPSVGLPDDANAILHQLDSYPSFLMVGTIEPRKGHVQVLDAFEQLWQSGANINLVIVGKQGWMVEELVVRLRSHPKLNKRLFWLEGISDEYLEKVYAVGACLIAASYGEGFGLPLIEAAQHGLPIVARDIPVFREVANNYAYFFQANTSNHLAQKIKEWLLIYQKGEHPKPDEMPWLTWKESARQLLSKMPQ